MMTGRFMVIASLLAATVALAACGNTVKGAGRDIQKSGQAVERAAR